MADQNEILRRLAEQTGGAQTVEQLRAALGTPDGKRAAQVISAAHAEMLERAAQAAQRGDFREAALIAQRLMQSQEGTALASQIKKLLGRQGG